MKRSITLNMFDWPEYYVKHTIEDMQECAEDFEDLSKQKNTGTENQEYANFSNLLIDVIPYLENYKKCKWDDSIILKFISRDKLNEFMGKYEKIQELIESKKIKEHIDNSTLYDDNFINFLDSVEEEFHPYRGRPEAYKSLRKPSKKPARKISTRFLEKTNKRTEKPIRTRKTMKTTKTTTSNEKEQIFIVDIE